MYTKQQTFNRVVKHLSGMTARAGRVTKDSIVCEFECTYRDDNGRRCAVGALIPDEVYVCSMEGFPLGGSQSMRKLVKLLGHDWKLCRDLQVVHDNYFDEREFALECVAQKHGLRMPELET